MGETVRWLGWLSYPAALAAPGTPLAEFVRHRLNQGACYAHEDPAEDREALIADRVTARMANGNETVKEHRPDGRTFEVRRRPPEGNPLRIVDVAEAAFDLVGYTLRCAGRQITRDLPSDLHRISADADQLVQVMINLLTNAHQTLLTRVHPRLLAISGRAGADGGLVVTFADNGPGVPLEVRERVFDPFFTTKPEGMGTGVGLSLCRSIVTAHGGAITLEETPCGGAMVRIVLPPGPRASGRAADQTSRPALVTRRLRSTLVVDDGAEVGAVLAEILRADCMLVDTASDGAGAQAMLAERDVDLIITDLRMPGGDGMALHRWLADTRPELAKRVVFVTGDRISTAIDIALRDTGRPVLAKPFAPADVRREPDHDRAGRRLSGPVPVTRP